MSKILLKGSDYSKHNGGTAVVASDEFVLLRAGYGSHTEDKRFRENVEKCKKKGIPYGVYWFSYAISNEGAANEADQCINIIKSVDYKPEFPVYYDNEYDSNDYYCKKVGYRYSPGIYQGMVNSFCERVEALGYYAGVYVNKDYFRNYLGDDIREKYTIWLADYQCGASENAFVGRHKNVHIIQYTNVPWDKNICRIDFPTVMRRAHLNGW